MNQSLFFRGSGNVNRNCGSTMQAIITQASNKDS